MRTQKWAPAAVAAALILSACAAPPPKPVTRENLIQRTATVESIDQASRLVTLRGEDGHGFTVQVSDEVRNLAQVKAGDKVTVSFFEALAAEVRKSGEGVQGVEADVAAVRSEPGQMPGGGVGVLLRTTVEIVSVDTSFNTVTFRRSDGAIRVVAVQTAEGRQFIRGLRAGDRVDIAYTEAFAIEVKPAG
jgi:translation initiation factor IF-1